MLNRLYNTFLKRNPYPKIIIQKNIQTEGVLFEVTNEIEEWRVVSLDDEEEFLKELATEIRPDDIFFDIGACIGIYSLNLASLCNKVFAFEPDPSFNNRLLRNIELNNKKNIFTLPIAISDENGEVDFYTDGVKGRSPSLENLGQKRRLRVLSKSLDNLSQEINFIYPTIIKMDIEGAELMALKGAKNLLNSAQFPRSIFLEVHPSLLKKYGQSKEELENFLNQSGYHIIKMIIRDTQYHLILKK